MRRLCEDLQILRGISLSSTTVCLQLSVDWRWQSTSAYVLDPLRPCPMVRKVCETLTTPLGVALH